jgi:hypothetical protein
LRYKEQIVMARFHSPLDEVRVASPCPADWDQMIGTEQVRFCAQCRLNVYNLSGMTRAQAEHLIAGAEGRLCVRYYRRADGSILTQNCPVGWERVRQRWSKVRRAVASAVLGFFGGIAGYEGAQALALTTRPQVVMGDIAALNSQGRIDADPPYSPVMGQPVLEMGKRVALASRTPVKRRK